MDENNLPTWGQLSREIGRLRNDAGMPQVTLGNIAGYSSSPNASISRIENCKIKIPSSKLALIAQHFQITPYELAQQACQLTLEAESEGSLKSFKNSKISQKYIDDAAEFLKKAKGEPTNIDEWATRLDDEIKSLNNRLESAFEAWQEEVATLDTNVLRRVLKLLRETKPSLLDGLEDLHNTSATPDKVEELDLFKFTQNGVNQLLATVPAALGTATGAGLAGTVYSAVAAFGTASSGIAIGSLSGVALTNATLAAIGGGSLAAGGAGMLGGTIALGSIFGIPALLGVSYTIFKLFKLKQERDQRIREELRAAEKRLIEATLRIDASIASSQKVILLMQKLQQVCMDLFVQQAIGASGENEKYWLKFHQVLVLGNYLAFIPVWSLASDMQDVSKENLESEMQKIDSEMSNAETRIGQLL